MVVLERKGLRLKRVTHSLLFLLERVETYQATH